MAGDSATFQVPTRSVRMSLGVEPLVVVAFAASVAAGVIASLGGRPGALGTRSAGAAASWSVSAARSEVSTAAPSPSASPFVGRTPALGASAMTAPAEIPPACTVGDDATAHDRQADWARTLVDTDLRLPAGYIPTDLVSTDRTTLGGGFRIRAIVVPDLRAMAVAAARGGVPLAIASAYRSYMNQAATFAGWVAAYGRVAAIAASARPGHSEHQLGVAIDFKARGGAAPWNAADWALSPTGAWLAANAWRYGFVMSYPAGAADRTCYEYEPWHYRFVGRDEAREIHDRGVSVRVYLWARQ